MKATRVFSVCAASAILGVALWVLHASRKVIAAPDSRSYRVCEVIRQLDAFRGKRVSITGYLTGSTLEGVLLAEDASLGACSNTGLPWFRWRGALLVDLLRSSADINQLRDANGLFMTKARVTATVEAKSWRFIICPTQTHC